MSSTASSTAAVWWDLRSNGGAWHEPLLAVRVATRAREVTDPTTRRDVVDLRTCWLALSEGAPHDGSGSFDDPARRLGHDLGHVGLREPKHRLVGNPLA